MSCVFLGDAATGVVVKKRLGLQILPATVVIEMSKRRFPIPMDAAGAPKHRRSWKA